MTHLKSFICENQTTMDTIPPIPIIYKVRENADPFESHTRTNSTPPQVCVDILRQFEYKWLSLY